MPPLRGRARRRSRLFPGGVPFHRLGEPGWGVGDGIHAERASDDNNKLRDGLRGAMQHTLRDRPPSSRRHSNERFPHHRGLRELHDAATTGIPANVAWSMPGFVRYWPVPFNATYESSETSFRAVRSAVTTHHDGGVDGTWIRNAFISESSDGGGGGVGAGSPVKS